MKKISTRRRHPLAAFVVLTLALAFAGALYSALISPSANADAGGASLAQQVQQGKLLYINSCSACHGMNVEGSSNGPSLIGVGSASVDFQMSTGRMPAQQPGAQIQAKPGNALDQYSQQQIDDIAAYVQSLGGGPAIPASSQYATESNMVALGGVLFRTNCTQCHNFAGEGGALTNGAYAPALVQTAPVNIYEAMLTGPQNMPVFNDSVLSPADKQAIVSYIVADRNEPNPGGAGLGRLGPTSEGLFLWTAVLAILLLLAVWIAAHTTKASAERVAQAAAAKSKSEK
ncbi:MAG TPA: c-type cytochrome [Actinocrinis sp.]|nr:c-type cytochrome [Actinocrinis sp.]